MEKEITIPIEEYNKLIKFEKYIQNWEDPVPCKRCGNLNPSGYICAECGWDNTFTPTEEDMDYNETDVEYETDY